MSHVAPPAKYDVLSEPLFTTNTGGRTSLAQLLSNLLVGPDPLGFPNLAAEQRGYWWRFLVRCATKALRELGLAVDGLPGRAESITGQIEGVLRDLVPEGGWMLYQPGPSEPGFLQPPTPNGRAPEESYKKRDLSLLSVVIGGKNHERKVSAGRSRTPEGTAFGLVEYQGGVIYGGAGNYGTQLVGSASGAGSGSPFMGARIGTGLVESFRHDVVMFLANWDEVVRRNGLRGDVWALWAEPWTGRSKLPAKKLDPAFIPMARLVRLGEPMEGHFQTIWFSRSKCSRVDDHTEGGNLGDPFSPLVPHQKKGHLKVRGTLSGGYGYREVVRLLFGAGGQALPSPSVAALQGQGDDRREDLKIVFEGVAFGQGKTLGFYQRSVMLPPGANSFLAEPAPVREVHEAMFRMVFETKNALRGAMRKLLTGSSRQTVGDRRKVEAPNAILEHIVDQIYVQRLIEATTQHKKGSQAWSTAWAEELAEMAMEAWSTAASAVPVNLGVRLEREVLAEDYLRGRLWALRPDMSDAEQPAEVEARQ